MFNIDEFEEIRKSRRDRFTRTVTDTPAGEAFFAMSSLARMRSLYGNPFRKTDGRLKAVTDSHTGLIAPSTGSLTEQLGSSHKPSSVGGWLLLPGMK
ncbi:MAG: hypothetical protein L0Y37_02820 [Bacteroidales bacterium]|nr:hypothetical protein [Bacteroidales bacterium]